MTLEMDQFHEVYFAESFELLDAMEAALLRLSPGAADLETVNTIFRVAHSIKGGAGAFGLDDLTRGSRRRGAVAVSCVAS